MTPAWLTVALSSTTVSAISREKSILFISVDPLSAAGAAQHAGTVGNPARAGAGELEHDTGGRARRQPTPDVHCDEGRARWRGATGRARRVEQRRVTAEIVERSGIGANPEALPATGENAPPPSASVPVIRITSGPFETGGKTCENNDTPAGIPCK